MAGIDTIRALTAPRTGVKIKAQPRKKMPESGKKFPNSGNSGRIPVKKCAIPKKTGNKQSKKLRAINRKLKKAYPIFLATRPDCEIHSPVCAGASSVVNHNKGRGANVLNQDDWNACCPPCNDYIEIHHEWAEARGFKKSRHKKDPK